MKIHLPYPPAILNPNVRSHWAPKAKTKKKYRRDCYYLAKRIRPEFMEGTIYLKIIFYPPDKRKRDLDNAIASFKAGQDGLADAWRVDDYRFSVSYAIGDIIKHGGVSVHIDQ